MLQYALLHLFGYKVSMDDLKAFRVRFSGFVSYEHHETNTDQHDSKSIALLPDIQKLKIRPVLKLQRVLSVRVSQMLSVLQWRRPTKQQSSTSLDLN
jgi:hypothetical protein